MKNQRIFNWVEVLPANLFLPTKILYIKKM